MVEVVDLSVSFRTGSGAPELVLRNVSLRLQAGEIVGLLGESGSGKTTLGMAIAGALPAAAHVDSGVVRGGRDAQRRARVALVPQSPSLVFSPFLHCGQQVRDVLVANEGNASSADTRVLELLAEVGLPSSRAASRAYPHELSGGELQRVAIARALAMSPDILIADESASALDALLTEDLLRQMLVLQQRQRIAIVWITHDPRELVGFADRILTMQRGELVEEASASMFEAGQVGTATLDLLAAMPLGSHSLKAPGNAAREPSQ